MIFINDEDNRRLISRLENVVQSGSVSHAYIFEGDNCIDKLSFAKSFAKGILCPRREGNGCDDCGICRKIDHGNHEDLLLISGRDESIKDEMIIGMQKQLKTKPFGTRHIAIFDGCDNMTPRAQNRLLKTLEEPPGASVIMLLSENIENLVQTIRSRCVKYRINYFGTEGYEHMLGEAEKFIEMLMNKEPFYKTKKKAEKLASSGADTGALLDGMEIVLRNMILDKNDGIVLYKKEDIINDIYAVENARRQIKQGVSPVYAIKNLALKIGG